MTLFDIFYQHTEWWCNPDLGHDTQGKYGEVLKEMEDCALDYARSIKDTGDRWKRVIENETRKLCLPNHYSWNLRGDKKKWHDTVVSDFLIRIRKAIEHCYGYNFTELPKSILPSYGIYCYEWSTNRKPQQKHIEAPQQPIGGSGGELAGNDKRTHKERTKKTFKDRIAGNVDSDALIAKLHTLMDSKKGKDALIYLVVCVMDGKLISLPTYKETTVIFPNIGCRAGYYRYTVSTKFRDSEIEGARKALNNDK